MTQLYESIIADTSFEAKQIAKSKYGENIEIVKEEPITNKFLFGMGQREQVKLTIAVKDFGRKNTSFSSQHHLPAESLDKIKPDSVKEARLPYEPRQIKVSPTMVSSTYRRTLQTDRDVDGIRSLQEGDSEPRSQKLNCDDYPKMCSDTLSTLERIKKQRQKEQEALQGSRINATALRTIEELQKQLDTLINKVKILSESSEEFRLGKKNLSQGLSDLEHKLLEIETPQEIIDSVFRELRMSYTEEELSKTYGARKALHGLLRNNIPISKEFEIKKTSKPQVIVFMGPTGVGKTTTLAKLASKFCLNPEKPIKGSIINIDFYKLGAKEQLQSYANICGIPLEDVTSIASLDFFLSKHSDDDLIIVDTAGRSQYDYEDLKELRAYIERIPNATRYLTVASTSKYSDLKEIVNSFSHIGFDHFILTKIDETKTIGPAVGMLLKCKKSLAYITHGQIVPQDYKVADFDFFEEKIFGTDNFSC